MFCAHDPATLFLKSRTKNNGPDMKETCMRMTAPHKETMRATTEPTRISTIGRTALAWAIVLSSLLAVVPGTNARPRAPSVPLPEWSPILDYEGFDDAYWSGATNDQLTL